MNFSNTFAGKTALITGHSGFKGGWLGAWLKALGCDVFGLSLEPITQPSLFDSECSRYFKESKFVDICDLGRMQDFVCTWKPDFIFHLAAQALVFESVKSPYETFRVNTLGTASLLESVRLSGHDCSVVMVTSDKCYVNKEWAYPYREIDQLGGDDPYSASKASAELVISSYAKTFGNQNGLRKIVSVRAGNVVGGGDWSNDRLVPDMVRAITNGRVLKIRNKSATRPWQHVLEPLSGYLRVAQLLEQNKINGFQSFNFGPDTRQTRSVSNFIQSAMEHKFVKDLVVEYEKSISDVEKSLLQLDSSSARDILNWSPTFNFSETISFTFDWYERFYLNQDTRSSTLDQINIYTEKAVDQGKTWMV